MATLKGTWRFNDIITDPYGSSTSHDEYFYANFTCPAYDYQFTAFRFIRANYADGLSYLVDLNVGSYGGFNYDTLTWANEGSKTITFTSEQEVSDEFYDWFTANATPQAKEKVFTKLNIGDTVATSGTRVFRKLTTDEPIVGGYLTFSSPSAFTLSTIRAKKTWDGILEYSTNADTWDEWDGATTLSADSGVLHMRGTGNTKITSVINDRWVLNGTNIACEGNIENILDYATVASGKHPPMADSCYYGMFYGCTSLTTAPQLQATTLTDKCYGCMFHGCTSLTTAPQLQATTLADSCYFDMFYGCTSLTTAPQLPATTLADKCYCGMFHGCTSLTTAPQLPATTLDISCYQSMFYGCTSLTTAPQLQATTLTDKCYYGMFYGCTSLTTAPQLQATTLADSCYYFMFYGCKKIKLSTTQVGEYQKPYRIPTGGTGTTATNALLYMFANTGGTFTGTPTINTTYYTSNEVV